MTATIHSKLVLLAAIAAGALSIAAPARAGGCPPGKEGIDVMKPNGVAAKGVTDTVLASIDLSNEKVGLANHLLRIRRLEIQPGGIVPWHSHADRPALIYIIQGEITEYASSCTVPIMHKSGDVARETSVTAHWWQNTGSQQVVLISADLLHDLHDHNM